MPSPRSCGRRCHRWERGAIAAADRLPTGPCDICLQRDATSVVERYVPGYKTSLALCDECDLVRLIARTNSICLPDFELARFPDFLGFAQECERCGCVDIRVKTNPSPFLLAAKAGVPLALVIRSGWRSLGTLCSTCRHEGDRVVGEWADSIRQAMKQCATDDERVDQLQKLRTKFFGRP